jgi:hypothetical protein
MRPRTLAILTVVVAGLAAFIWFVERDLPSSDERARREKRVVLLEAEDVDRLTVAWADQVVELIRNDSPETAGKSADGTTDSRRGWTLVRPLEARADAVAVEGLVGRLVELEKERTLEDVRPEDVGLAEPRGRVTLATDEAETVLEVGAEIPASSNMTLAVHGLDEIYVVRDSIWATLTKEPGEWRDRRLFVGETADIDRVTLRHGDGTVELVRRGEAFWIEAPIVDLADATAVSSLLSTVAGMSAESFVDQVPDAGTLGLTPPVHSIELVRGGGGESIRLEVGAPVAEGGSDDVEVAETPAASQSRYLRLNGQVVTTTAALSEHLERTPQEWRSLDWVSSESFDVERLVVTDALGELELRREDGDWLRDAQRIVYGPATDLLYAVTGARAIRALEADPDSLGAARLTLVLEAGDGRTETAWLYPAGEEGAAVRVSGREAALLLSSETAAEISAAIEAVRGADLDEPAAEDA